MVHHPPSCLGTTPSQNIAGWVGVGFEMVQICIKLNIMWLRCNVASTEGC